MNGRLARNALVIALGLGFPALSLAAAITELDSTQPRGAAMDRKNERGQPLGPVVEGFRAAPYRANEQDDLFRDWAGSMMANATRDPSFYAALSVANKNFIRLVNSLPGEPGDASSPLGAFLKQNKLDKDIRRAEDGSLQPEELLPVAADMCLRCHSPVGWMEAHSEPPTQHAPFLKGQFWGAAFLGNPTDGSKAPRQVDVSRESEAELEGIDCDFCHRVKDSSKRQSRHDGSWMANGNGGFFVDPESPFCQEQDENGACAEESVEPEYDILGESEFCAICHDVTNPLLQTQTLVKGEVPVMNHPIERTYTEWYWSAYRGEQTCQDCHEPMTFQGAQTWLISPALEALWGDFDRVWREPPYEYDVPARPEIYKAAAEFNRAFMREEAAEILFVETPAQAAPGESVTVKVKVVNKAGHKLPTGFAEGRQMWIHIRAVDESGTTIFEDGSIRDGRLVRTPETKVYEQVVLAKGHPFLDANGDGKVDEKEGHFHFVLLNSIKKDNRIPPKGYNKAAYLADGVFILPYDPKDTDYADGQNWDITPYTFLIPKEAQGTVRVEATLRYQTFNREYMEFLRDYDTERTQECGGRARNLPATGQYAGNCDEYPTWGKVVYDLWMKAGMGPPVDMGSATIELAVQG